MTSVLAQLRRPLPKQAHFLESSSDFFIVENGVTKLRELTEEETAQLAETSRVAEKNRDFRTGSVTTHERLDRHLREYRRCMIFNFALQNRKHELLTEDDSESDNDRIFFPNDNLDQIYANIGFYFTYICPRLKARSNKDSVVKISTLAVRRWSMLYWMKMYLDNPPGFRRLQAKTNPALYGAAQEYGVKPSNFKRTYFGRYELQYLMDKDLELTVNMEIAECHHLAWNLAYVCGIRPGAIGWHRGRPNSFLRWEHISIRRSVSDSKKFVLDLTLPFMKGHQDLDKLEDGHDGSLELTLEPPNNPDNIPICPTYRLLVIAIRRGLLKSYTTVDQLLNGKGEKIIFKPEALTQPIFFATKPGGYQLTRTPASSSSFSSYLSKRASDNGFPDGCTIYSFRGELGTKIDRLKDRATARRVLHHNPNSKTFEKHHDKGNYDLDIGRIAYGEEEKSAEMIASSHAILYRAEMHLTLPEQRAAIEAAVDEWTPAGASTNEVRRTRRLARTAIKDLAASVFKESFTHDQLKSRMAALNGMPNLTKAMYEHARDKMQAANLASTETDNDDNDDNDNDNEEDDEDDAPDDITGDEASEDDAHDLNAELYISIDGKAAGESRGQGSPETNELMDVEDRAPDTRLPAAGQSVTIILGNIDRAKSLAEGTEFANEYDIPTQKAWLVVLDSYAENTEWTHSSDASGRYAQLPSLINKLRSFYRPLLYSIQTDRLDDDETGRTAISYDLALISFFEMLLDKQTLPGEPRQCTECLADDTVTGDAKTKWYESASKFQRHITSNHHAPWRRWVRKAERVKMNSLDGLYHCYPDSGCDKTYRRLDDLQEHLLVARKNIDSDLAASPDGKTYNVHHRYLIEDSWFSPAFKQSRRNVAEARAHKLDLKKNEARRSGIAPKLDELTVLRPAIIDGKPSTHVYVGPSTQSLSEMKQMVSYPPGFPVGANAPQQLKDECEQKGLVGHFVNFSGQGESAQRALDRWTKQGVIQSKTTDKKLPKY
ncbi:hypothetical protein LTR17_022292 [Elasticomyces elasticus]|nr:hypothetical protein LTR17_022292 [Elasticomyces elasticus]